LSGCFIKINFNSGKVKKLFVVCFKQKIVLVVIITNIGMCERLTPQKLISKTRSTIPWFYLRGPYNDVWGSDILQFPQLLASCSPEYYFINNPALSITSTYENSPQNSYQGYVIKVFGLGVK